MEFPGEDKDCPRRVASKVNYKHHIESINLSAACLSLPNSKT